MADDCAALSGQIAALRAQIAAIQPVNKNDLIASVKSSLMPDVTTAIAAAGAIITNKFQPQINKAFGDIVGLSDADKAAKLAAAQAAKDAQALAAQNARDLYNKLSQTEKEIRETNYAANLANQKYLKANVDKLLTDEALARSLQNQKIEIAEQNANKAANAEFKQAFAKYAAENPGDQLVIDQAARDAAAAASRKADAAIADAATKATKEEVNGVKGLINNVKQDVAVLGESVSTRFKAVGTAIEKVTATAGEAVAKSLEAIGVSRGAQAVAGEALGKVFELVNKIAGIFVIIAAIQEIIAQLKTLEVLGDRIDAVERESEAVGNSVSNILGTLLTFKNRIAKNELTIDDVKGIAIKALDIGNAASALATRARAIGIDAKNEAANALLRAGEAVATTAAVLVLFKGIKVLKGDRGLQGIPGIKGKDGLDGKNGISVPSRNGINGTDGKNGVDGKNGINGVTTIIQIPGTPGTNGRDGKNGISGIGTPGKNGIPGKNGTNGKNGIDGKNGINGINGTNGIDGKSTIGIPGKNGINGKDGKDVNPGDLAELKGLIIQQHAVTRVTVNTNTTGLFAAFQAYYASTNAALTALITAIATNTYVEKALSLLTFAATIHNGFMLTTNLGQTLGSIIDQCLLLILPKGINGQPLNISNTLGKTATVLIESVIGEKNYNTISSEWAQANRIYQASSNVFNQVGNAVGMLSSGMEMVGGNVGKIGNALKIWGVVGQHAYNTMNPQPKIHGKFFEYINSASAEANAIQMIVAIPIGLGIAAGGINDSINQLAIDVNQKDPVDDKGNPLKDFEGRIIHYKPGMTTPDPVVTVKADEQSKADSTNIIVATIEDLFNAND